MDKMTRQELIDALTDDAIDTALNFEEYLESIFKEGFKGFVNYSNEELVRAYQERFPH